ncbi:MAG: flagellar hook capping FlgD N-terminal domain-containing protein [Planctomycetota bacterium]
MDIRQLSAGASAPTSKVGDPNAAFRDADFLAIMLAEISNQDPFEPQETGKIVENMKKLQDLANTRHEKYRDDLRWAQQMVGQSVTIGQASLEEPEAQALRERGVYPDVGFGVVEGVVEGYRSVDEVIWVTVDGKDYQLENLQVLHPEDDTRGLVGLADDLIGRRVDYLDPQNGAGSGLVSNVEWSDRGEVTLTVDGQAVDFAWLRGMGG